MTMSKRFRLEEKIAHAKNHLENLEEAYIKLRFKMDQLKADMQKANKIMRATELELAEYNEEFESFDEPQISKMTAAPKGAIRISGGSEKLMKGIADKSKSNLRLPCSDCVCTYKWNPEEMIICTTCDDAEREADRAMKEDVEGRSSSGDSECQCYGCQHGDYCDCE